MARFSSARRIARVAWHVGRAALHFALDGRGGREYRQQWSWTLLEILDVRLEARSVPVGPGTLLIANHVSWLDVIVLTALVPGCFVAKAEIRRWPLIGWLLERNSALFLDRRVGRHLLDLNAQIAAHLAAGEVVAFFPEGTTTDGTGLLPFRTALFEPAARGGHRIRPFAIAYRDGSGRRCAAAAFVGRQSLWASLCDIAAQSGVTAWIEACDEIAAERLPRRELARRAHSAVQHKLLGGASLPACQKPAGNAAGAAGSASAAGIAPSSTAPIWPSCADVART